MAYVIAQSRKLLEYDEGGVMQFDTEKDAHAYLRELDERGHVIWHSSVLARAYKPPLNIQVQRIYRFETHARPLKAFVDIVINNALLIKGIKVLDGKNGLFVSMPQEQAKDKKWYESVRCLTQETRDLITETVLLTYRDENKSRPEKRCTCNRCQRRRVNG